MIIKPIQPIYFILFTWVLISCGRSPRQQPPLSLHPQNPHYFLFHGKPAILIGSTEHYGAVMNLDFNYVTYLNEIAASGLNVTRTFSGVYVEPDEAFGIKKNTMAPAPERYICPWARSTKPGYSNGGNKFNLSKWNKAYFSRLKDFVAEAGKRNIIVELDLFSNFYDTVQWKLSPLNIMNNVNGIGDFQDQKEILSLRHPEIIEVQENMVRKIVNELKDFDNLYYEICNEPYFGDTLALREWERHMTAIVVDAEKKYYHKHLISNNIANFYRTVPDPREGVSIYNFHYARPPVTVDKNYHLNKVIGDNETGFAGIEDSTYRIEAWEFIMAGGGLFNHLDYSFTTENADGSFKVDPGQPGGGSKTLRNQFKILSEFMQGFDYIHMVQVKNDRLRFWNPESFNIEALAKAEGVFAIYFHRKDRTKTGSVFEINLLAGSYNLTWVDTKTAGETVEYLKNHPGGWASITSPDYSIDIALRLEMAK